MTKPNFSRTIRQELKAYALAYRADDEAIEALIKRGDPNSSKFRFPQTEENLREVKEILQRKLGSSGEAI